MTRPLVLQPAADVPALLPAIRAALDGSGPAVLPSATAARAEPAGEVPRQVALVIETSGSTGAPKRVALSADALLAHAAASAAALGGPVDGARDGEPGTSQWLLCLPAHYVAGAQVLVRSIVAGTEPVLTPLGHFDPAAFRDAALAMTGDERFVSLVPVQLGRLLDAARGDATLEGALRRFRAILVGGQALRPELRERAEAAGLRVVRTYGSSETAGGCVYDGIPLGPVGARALDGHLELSGPTLAWGYLDDPERTDATFRMDDGVRWYHTGDLGAVDAEGRVAVFGRADNVIISGGEKVLLDAVERQLRSLPGLDDVVVVAADDPEWGQVPVAITTAADASLESLRSSAAAALGRAAAPARVVVVPTIPLLDSGKPDRLALAALARDPLA